MRNISMQSILENQAELFQQIENYAFGVAARQNARELEYLFHDIPSLLQHTASRKKRNGIQGFRGDIVNISLPWAIFDEITHYHEHAQECMVMLQRIGYRLDDMFIINAVMKNDSDLLRGMCETFDLDTSAPIHESMSIVRYMYDRKLGHPDGIKDFEYVLSRARDINALHGSLPQTILFTMMMNPWHSNLNFKDEIFQRIQICMKYGANPNIRGWVNGWTHNNGEGELLPLMHALEWLEYTGRCAFPEMLDLGRSLCRRDILDDAGRTATQYRKHLVKTKAPK